MKVVVEGRLTKPPFFDLCGREDKDREEFNHDVNYHCVQVRSRPDLGINPKPSQEVLDTFEYINEGVVVFLRGLRRLDIPQFRGVTRMRERNILREGH